jgi:hypothetical protein
MITFEETAAGMTVSRNDKAWNLLFDPRLLIDTSDGAEVVTGNGVFPESLEDVALYYGRAVGSLLATNITELTIERSRDIAASLADAEPPIVGNPRELFINSAVQIVSGYTGMEE